VAQVAFLRPLQKSNSTSHLRFNPVDRLVPQGRQLDFGRIVAHSSCKEECQWDHGFSCLESGGFKSFQFPLSNAEVRAVLERKLTQAEEFGINL